MHTKSLRHLAPLAIITTIGLFIMAWYYLPYDAEIRMLSDFGTYVESDHFFMLSLIFGAIYTFFFLHLYVEKHYKTSDTFRYAYQIALLGQLGVALAPLSIDNTAQTVVHWIVATAMFLSLGLMMYAFAECQNEELPWYMRKYFILGLVAFGAFINALMATIETYLFITQGLVIVLVWLWMLRLAYPSQSILSFITLGSAGKRKN